MRWNPEALQDFSHFQIAELIDVTRLNGKESLLGSEFVVDFEPLAEGVCDGAVEVKDEGAFQAGMRLCFRCSFSSAFAKGEVWIDILAQWAPVTGL